MGPQVMMSDLTSGVHFVRNGKSYTRLPDGTRKSDGSEVNALCTHDGGYHNSQDFGKLEFIDQNEMVNYAHGAGISIEYQVMSSRE